MTDPTENEEINEELSTDELKSVSGGFGVGDVLGFEGTFPLPGGVANIQTLRPSTYTEIDENGTLTNPHGSGFGGTREDWEKSKFKGSYI